MFSAFIFLVYLIGFINAAHAVMSVRSAQGAIAWAMSLISFPFITIPLYWVFGRNRFHGYVKARRLVDSESYPLLQEAYNLLAPYQAQLTPECRILQIYAEHFSHFSFTHSNAVRLLIDGNETFYAMQEAIKKAQHYILIQFYIVNDDIVGRHFKQLLLDQVHAGIEIYFIYDEFGCHALPNTYLDHLKQCGVNVVAFGSTRGYGNYFQVNFRNHRKIVLVDGLQTIVGGLNLGQEYLGHDPELGYWRDTAILLRGPAVQGVQASFLEDWLWATGTELKLNWQAQPAENMNAKVLILPTGPADKLQNCSLFFVTAIAQAQQRLWIASPYFVPDEVLVSALQMAALRGVDVRILLPDKADHLFVFLASFSYYEEMQAAGVKLYRYRDGFMHQKTMLIDDQIATIGTVNLDNRSFRLNFEISAFLLDHAIIAAVHDMLQRDFQNAVLVDQRDYEQKPFWFQVLVQFSRLLTPIL